MTPITLGKVVLPSNVILAPMAGVTDLPFRKIVRKFGDFLMFSEMVASNAVIRKVARSCKMIEGADDPYTSVQIVGADPAVMADAARLSVDLGARLIDINMGCPVKKIVKSDAGSALMKDEKLAASIIDAVVKAVPSVPVTLKTRLGWDHNHKNAPQIAHIAEDLGVQMVTIHGRTRSQLYTGQADWQAIRAVKEAVTIPVIANGDITDIPSAQKALERSGADGIMIGRGSLGRPWLLKQIHGALLGEDIFQNVDRLKIAREHLDNIFEFHDEFHAVLLSRKALMYYCKNIPNAAAIRHCINNITARQDAYNLLTSMRFTPPL